MLLLNEPVAFGPRSRLRVRIEHGASEILQLHGKGRSTTREAQEIAATRIQKYCAGHCGAVTLAHTQKIKKRWLVDFDGNYSIYDKLSNGDVEVVRCCDCLQFGNERLECLGANRFNWSCCCCRARFCCADASTLAP